MKGMPRGERHEVRLQIHRLEDHLRDALAAAQNTTADAPGDPSAPVDYPKGGLT
jgi:hypothetical protein